MTNSHWLGLITFGACALFALLAWVVSYTHPAVNKDRATRRSTRITALCLLLFGAGFGYLAFSIDYQMRVTTLHEVMLDGNAGAASGTPAPLQTVSFTVEHPGVAHNLFLSPTSELFDPPRSAAEVSFSLNSPDGKALLPEQTERFEVRPETDNDRADWDGKTFSFTPTAAGPHTVRLRLLTPGIPKIQVRIEDPSKRNGERMSGY